MAGIDEVPATEGAKATAISSLEWKRRWERDVEWISADAADICDYWKADNQHGKKGKLQDKLGKEMGQFRPDSGTAVLPEGRVLVKRVEQIVRAWSCGRYRARAMMTQL
mmetsp:Transcript_41986/g.75381  ORF Transcript_41986/g.75381 Transcript_41986/m.75381 type:complete len:109 (-) Transcript_41986:172-498(-)